LKREAEGLDYLPYPGELGKRIYDSIPRKLGRSGWRIRHADQRKPADADRTSAGVPGAEMEKFLFASGSEKPKGIRAEIAAAEARNSGR